MMETAALFCLMSSSVLIGVGEVIGIAIKERIRNQIMSIANVASYRRQRVLARITHTTKCIAPHDFWRHELRRHGLAHRQRWPARISWRRGYFTSCVRPSSRGTSGG